MTTTKLQPNEKFTTTILYREDLEADEDLGEEIVEEEQINLLYKTLFYTGIILLINLIAW